jgi:hypothetical protein
VLNLKLMHLISPNCAFIKVQKRINFGDKVLEKCYIKKSTEILALNVGSLKRTASQM